MEMYYTNNNNKQTNKSHMSTKHTKTKQDVQAQLTDAEKKLPIYRRLKSQTKVINGWIAEDQNWLDHLAYLSAILPGADEIFVSAFTTSPQHLIRFSVQAKTGELLAELDKKLRAAGYEVRPLSITPANDKNGYNFLHIALLRIAFPNAKILDMRRHPLGCCYANFTVSFSYAPPLSYSQSDIARFYADYVRLMAHFERVQPGAVHRVIYEHLVENLEGEIRRMLDFLGLPFEPGCLEYYKTERFFSSFSNEHVRRPIFREGLDR